MAFVRMVLNDHSAVPQANVSGHVGVSKAWNANANVSAEELFAVMRSKLTGLAAGRSGSIATARRSMWYKFRQ